MASLILQNFANKCELPIHNCTTTLVGANNTTINVVGKTTFTCALTGLSPSLSVQITAVVVQIFKHDVLFGIDVIRYYFHGRI